MTTLKTVALSFAAGILGGTLAIVGIAPMQAQEPEPQAAPVTAAEVRAQSFILVWPNGEPAGRFGFDKNGHPAIQLLDQYGNERWSATAPPHVTMAPLSRP